MTPPKAHPRSHLHPRPAGNAETPELRVAECQAGRGPAAAEPSDQRDGVPERQMLCRMTPSFLASATRALPMPDRLAIAEAQSFSVEGFLSRVMITIALY